MYRNLVGPYLGTGLSFERSFLAVPLMHKDRVTGVLGLSSRHPAHYTSHHANVAIAVAQQAGIAIENARLFARAQGLAAVDERHRLSREPHDSVSQALYGIVLGTKTARNLLDRDPAAAAEALDFAVAQAETGLAEMRMLIFALRPEALEREELTVALAKQAERLQAWQALRIETSLGEEPVAPLPVKEALYRIAQEALQNTVKHARATEAGISLAVRPGNVLELCIWDDGQGFNADGSFPGHMGLQSMRERAERAGGSLHVESSPTAGTRIIARVPLNAPVQ